LVVGEEKIQKVTHMQFTMWPNYGVVENVEQLANFVREVYKEARKREGRPIVIHCSGGVGRSGTFTTIYSIYSMLVDSKRTGVWTEMEEYIGKDGELLLEPLVRKLREIRHPWMVEGEQQYRLAYQGCTEIARGFMI
jgi:protein tyrosine phosphatase